MVFFNSDKEPIYEKAAEISAWCGCMGDKKPASYPVNHNEAAIENNSKNTKEKDNNMSDTADLGNGNKNVQTSMQQVSVPLHQVFNSLKDSGMPETNIFEIVFRLGLNIGKLV